jgi:hypothetical protein
MLATLTKPKRDGEDHRNQEERGTPKKKRERKTKLENGEKQERILGAK